MSHFQWHFFIDFLDFFHKNFIWGALSNVLTILEIAYILTESQGMIYTLPMAIMLFYWSVRTLNKKFHERFLCVITIFMLFWTLFGVFLGMVTDGHTDGQTLLQRCEDASKKRQKSGLSPAFAIGVGPTDEWTQWL